MALDTLAFPEADAETFQQLEKTLFAPGRVKDQTRMRYSNRVRAEQKELERLLPGSLNSTVHGVPSLVRGSSREVGEEPGADPDGL